MSRNCNLRITDFGLARERPIVSAALQSVVSNVLTGYGAFHLAAGKGRGRRPDGEYRRTNDRACDHEMVSPTGTDVVSR